jgi:hypothetical protein
MSLMGYTEDDVEKMKEHIYSAIDYASNAKDQEVVEGCQNAIDFLDGLIIEGRV